MSILIFHHARNIYSYFFTQKFVSYHTIILILEELIRAVESVDFEILDIKRS